MKSENVKPFFKQDILITPFTFVLEEAIRQKTSPFQFTTVHAASKYFPELTIPDSIFIQLEVVKLNRDLLIDASLESKIGLNIDYLVLPSFIFCLKQEKIFDQLSTQYVFLPVKSKIRNGNNKYVYLYTHPTESKLRLLFKEEGEIIPKGFCILGLKKNST